MTVRLVCCGLATLDVVQVVEALPRPDEKVVAVAASVAFGGPAANAAATAVGLGVPTTLVTAIGSGPVAEAVRAGLVARGVDVVDLLSGRDASPPVSTVLVTRATGERAVVSVNATGAARLDEEARRAAPDVLRAAGALLVDGHHLAAGVELARAARRWGIATVLDGGSWKPGLDELLGLADHAVLSADFRVPDDVRATDRDRVRTTSHVPVGGSRPAEPAGHRTAEGVLARVARFGPATVARSAGAAPLVWRTSDGRRGEVVPPGVAAGDVADTLGAGDVLHGAFAATFVRTGDAVRSLERAVAVATRSVRSPGALGWLDA